MISGKRTQVFEYPTDQTTYLQGTSSQPTSCGTYDITVAPVVNVGGLGSNFTASPPVASGRAKSPNLTDNSGENMYTSGNDDGSGYLKSAAGRVGGAGLGMGLWMVVGLVVWVGVGGGGW